MQPIQKRPFQIIEKPTNVVLNLSTPTKKEINQYRNNFVPYYPKEYNPRELTQLFSFTNLYIVEKPTEVNKKTRKIPIIYQSHPIHIKKQPSKKITKKYNKPSEPNTSKTKE